MIIAHEISQAVDSSALRLSTYGFLSLGVQWTGDLLFAGVFLGVPRGRNAVLDLFQEYAYEAQLGALLGDSFLVIVAVLYASLLTMASDRHIVYVLLFQVYLVPYLVHSKKMPVFLPRMEGGEKLKQNPQRLRIPGRVAPQTSAMRRGV